MPDRSPVHKLHPDILFLIFALVASVGRPKLCSCIRHGPTRATLRDQPCCEKHPQCDTCIIGVPSRDTTPCTYSIGWVRIGHVCREWRTALLEAHQLWAKDVCTLNNSAVIEFLSRSGELPLVIDLTGIDPSHMRHPVTREQRVELLRTHTHRARKLRSDWYSWIPELEERPFPFLEELHLSTVNPSTMGILGPEYLLHGQDIDFYGQTHVISSALPLTLRAPSLRVLKLGPWTALRCVEIPRILAALPSIEELVLDLENHYPHSMLSEEDWEHNQDVMNLRGHPLSLPSITRLHVIGGGAKHPSISALLVHITSQRKASLRSLFLEKIDPSFLQAKSALSALRAHMLAIQSDSISLHFEGDYLFSVSFARCTSRYDTRNCPTTTVHLRTNLQDTIGSVAKRELFPALPLEHITHLFLDSLPPRSSQFMLSSALRQLQSVHTLHLGSHYRHDSSSLLDIGLYPLIGLRPEPWLPSLEQLHIDYPLYGESRTWWTQLAVALVARKRASVPFRALHIIGRWGLNARRPVDDTRTPLESFHIQAADPDAPDAYLATTSQGDFRHSENSRWAKDKVADVARSLFARIVDEIEVVEEPSVQPVWPESVW